MHNVFSDFLATLGDPCVRQLAHSVFAPPLFLALGLPSEHNNMAINAPQFELTEQRQAWLTRLDEQPQPLHQHLDTINSTRLGIYHEWLWLYFLQNDSQLNLLAHNSAVRHGGRTLGAFDFLYTENQQPDTLIHLEVATKYYLGLRPPLTQWRHWWGANTKDYLERKLMHLLRHQSRLAETEAARTEHAIIRDWLTRQRPITSRIQVGGRLFYPIQPQPECNDNISELTNATQHPQKFAAPRDANPDHLRGLWLTRSQWQQIKATALQYHEVEKLSWLDPLFYSTTLTGDTQDCEQLDKVEESDRRAHFIMVQWPAPLNTGPTLWQAIIVVEDNWQEKALQICRELPAL